MSELAEIVKIPINPENHVLFMVCIKYFKMEVTISQGFYVVEYNDPLDLYLLGCKMCRPTEDFRGTIDGMIGMKPKK